MRGRVPLRRDRDGARGVGGRRDDATGQLAQVSAPDGGEFGFSWDLAGRLAKMTRPNEVAEVLEWNEAGLLVSRNQVAADGSDVSGVSYGYDAGGRRTSMTDDSGTHEFSYDAAGNLTGADHPEGFAVADESFTYDKRGNRTSDIDNPVGSLVYDAANRLVRDAKHDYAHDGEGNLTSKKVRAMGATTRFVWDSEHRLVELVKPSGVTVRYRYDAAGMRVQATRASDGRVTTWGYNGSSVAAVWHQEAGEPRVLVSTFVTAPSGDPLQSTADGETVYSMLDGLGSVTGTLDAAGGVASSSAYSVFGQPAGTGPVGLGDVYGYTGHAWDADAGMHFARARWYDAGVGRFASEDPVDAMNLYPYVGNQPMDYVDPTGEIAAAQYSLISNRIQIAIAIGHMFMGDVEKWALDRGVPQGAICGANHVQTFALYTWGTAEFFMAVINMMTRASPLPMFMWMTMWALLSISNLLMYRVVGVCGDPPI